MKGFKKPMKRLKARDTYMSPFQQDRLWQSVNSGYTDLKTFKKYGKELQRYREVQIQQRTKNRAFSRYRGKSKKKPRVGMKGIVSSVIEVGPGGVIGDEMRESGVVKGSGGAVGGEEDGKDLDEDFIDSSSSSI